MKVIFKPKFYLGEIRMIYLERLYKKVFRVGGDEELRREADTLVNFAQWESMQAGHEFDTAVGERIMAAPDYPSELSNEKFPFVERAFVAECFKAANGADLCWSLYFLNADEVVESLREELELME